MGFTCSHSVGVEVIFTQQFEGLWRKLSIAPKREHTHRTLLLQLPGSAEKFMKSADSSDEVGAIFMSMSFCH